MVSFKTPDTAGDEDTLERLSLTEGHRNSATPQVAPCPGNARFPAALVSQAALQKGFPVPLYMLQKRSDPL